MGVSKGGSVEMGGESGVSYRALWCDNMMGVGKERRKIKV